MIEILWSLGGLALIWLIGVLIVGLKRKALSLHPEHLKVVLGDIRNFFRFSAGRHQQSLKRLYELLDLPPNALPATRGRAASPDFLLILAEHILSHRPKRVLECGPGVSSLVIAAALEKAGGGQLIALEHLEGYGSRVQRNIDEQGLAAWGRVVIAPLTPYRLNGREWQWYDIDKLPAGDWDMIVIDGPPASVGRSARYPAGPLLLPRLAENGHVFLDDADRQHDRKICERFAAEFGLETAYMEAEKGCIRLAWPDGRKLPEIQAPVATVAE